MRDGNRYPLDTTEPRQEFEDMKARRGRWSELWVEVLNDGSRATFVARDEIARVEVDLATTASDEVAAKDEVETRKREFRKRAGIPHESDEPSV